MEDCARQLTSKISKIIRLKNVDQIFDSGFHWVHRGEDQVTDQMVGVKTGERGRKKARVYELISAASFSWVSCFHFVGFRLSVEGDWFSLSSSQNPLRAETEKHGINFKTNPEGEIGHWPRHSSSREICRKKAFLIAPTTTKQRLASEISFLRTIILLIIDHPWSRHVSTFS